jgi:hypothetical protein
MGPKTVRKLERKVEEAIADLIISVGLGHRSCCHPATRSR